MNASDENNALMGWTGIAMLIAGAVMIDLQVLVVTGITVMVVGGNFFWSAMQDDDMEGTT